MAVKSLAQSSLVEPFSTNSMLAGYESNYFHHLETVRLSSSAASVTFSNLARYSDFQHLQIRSVVRSPRSPDNDDYLQMRINNATSNSYSWHELRGYAGSVASFSSGSSVSFMRIGNGSVPTAASVANTYASYVTDVIDPFEESKNTTIRSLGGASATLQMIELSSGAFYNTTAVDRIDLFMVYGSFVAGSRFSLYGIKARA